MRSISLVDRIEFDFAGTIARNGVAIGDVDNDGLNELVIGNDAGDLAVFKGTDRVESFSKLGFITCIAIGDILNQNKNFVVVVTGDGWCHIYETIESDEQALEASEEVIDKVHAAAAAGIEEEHTGQKHLVCIHTQRIPANAKDILLADIDGDGKIEMVLGLTDRVVRSYRWSSGKSPRKPHRSASPEFDKGGPKLVALNKWECAKQIGSISIHHSWDGTPSVLVAQPGGTFMRIQFPREDPKDTTEHGSSPVEITQHASVDYQVLGLSRMRNPDVSTEIMGDLRICSEVAASEDEPGTGGEFVSPDGTKARPYAVATLDGTIMLVQDEVIVWSMAVDHQIFAISKLDVTHNGADEIIACSWEGKTYILDQQKSCVKFHMEEPVQAFDCGYYSISSDQPSVACLVYVTFKKKIYLYHDIHIKNMAIQMFDPDLSVLAPLLVDDSTTLEQAQEIIKTWDEKKRKKVISELFYNVKG